jgi:holo-[acyl-carrier protein] synthase
MRVFGIGIDVVEVARIASAMERHGDPFMARVFTPAEREYCQSHHSPALHYAARFAAKEAVAKALGTGIGSHADLEIVHAAGGAPQLLLTGAAKDFAAAHGITDIQISLSHAHDYAAANAIALAEGSGIVDRGC